MSLLKIKTYNPEAKADPHIDTDAKVTKTAAPELLFRPDNKRDLTH